MTDQHDHLDDLASAHLDGHTTAEEAARVEADAELLARVARLAAARAALQVAAADPVDPAQRDRAVGTALAAFDELGIAPEADDAGAASPVVPLAGARWRTSRRSLQLVGIAAALVLLALTVPLLGRLGSGSDDQASFEESSAPAKERQAAGAASGSGPGADDATADQGAPTTPLAAAGALPDLGSFEELPALADSVRARLAPAPEVATGSSAAANEPACAAELAADGAPVTFSALATLHDRLVLVVVREGAGGERTLEVLDRASCTTITRAAL